MPKSEKKFSKVLWQSPLSVTVLTGKDGRYIDVNETFERITGWSREDVIGRTPFEIGLWADPEASRAIGELLLTGNMVRDLEVKTRTKVGEVRIGLLSAELIEFNGQPCVISVTADITQLRQAQEALSMVSRKLIEAHEQERAWLARELHDDISQRLCLLKMSLDDMNSRKTSPSGFRDGIGNAIQELSSLASDVQRLSHRLHSSKLEVLGLAMTAAAYCAEVADHHGVQIDLWIENMPSDLSADISLAIFRVLQEALQNSIKHSGSQRFQVLLHRKSNEVQLTVHDSGRGFDAAQAMKGRGLGLTSMKERAALVNGELSIDSQPQNGTTIYARVPLRSSTKSAHG